MVITHLPHAAISTSNSINWNIRVRYWGHRHIVEIVDWQLQIDIVQRYRLVIDFSLVYRALRGS